MNKLHNFSNKLKPLLNNTNKPKKLLNKPLMLPKKLNLL